MFTLFQAARRGARMKAVGMIVLWVWLGFNFLLLFLPLMKYILGEFARGGAGSEKGKDET